jgi:GDPmannose 4,6-dehydratase
MSKLAFITGITGQDGSYLSELLLNKEYKIYGIVRRTSLLYSRTRLDHIRDKINLAYSDLTDNSGLSTYINNIIRDNPNFETFEIYNLAAQSHVGISFQIPEYTSNVDGLGVLRLLEIIKNLDDNSRKKIKFYQACTSELYGKVLETPQNENTPFNPVSPYAISKLYGYYITKNYREAYGLYAINGILFNHESPRRGENFVTMKIINGIKDIISGKIDYIELGNIDSKRDWGHAKDYVNGMWLMMQQDKPDDFILSTGITTLVRDFVNKAFSYKNYNIKWRGSGIEEEGIDQNGIVRIKINKKYFRPCEVDLLIGDCSKAKEKLKWEKTYNTLESLIIDMFEGK